MKMPDYFMCHINKENNFLKDIMKVGGHNDHRLN